MKYNKNIYNEPDNNMKVNDLSLEQTKKRKSL